MDEEDPHGLKAAAEHGRLLAERDAWQKEAKIHYAGKQIWAVIALALMCVAIIGWMR